MVLIGAYVGRESVLSAVVYIMVQIIVARDATRAATTIPHHST